MRPSPVTSLALLAMLVVLLASFSCSSPDDTRAPSSSSCDAGGGSPSGSSTGTSGGGGAGGSPPVAHSCPNSACDDGDPCTSDSFDGTSCTTKPLPDGTICDDHGDMYCSSGKCVPWTNPLRCHHHADCGPLNAANEPTQFCLAGLCWPSCEGNNTDACRTAKPGSTCRVLSEPPFVHRVCQNLGEPRLLPECTSQSDCSTDSLCIDGSCWVDCSGQNYNRCLDGAPTNTTSCKRKVSDCSTYYVCQP